MHPLRFLQPTFIGVEDAEVIQHGRDIRVLGSEMFFVKLERVQIIWLGRFLPSAPAINQSDIIQHRAEIGVADVAELAPDLDRLFVESDCLLFVSARIAKVSRRRANR